ncbi:unnamed protein product [Miscanthus lutarioriparius]|uniref:Rx N-terminal domain-containing protein n=1 Tax=Miscanthus lutarioriparius TaxID=422564 RepID=A0A811QB04_9POAL|nr:unnamed protein product [Miscanthus lutarioriparius]
MVGSAVAQEAVNEILSRIKEGYAEKSDAKEHIERMEMAHIKLEAAIEASNKWNITSPPLLRWRRKLKRATQECDHTLRRCRQRLQEEEEVKHGLQSSSFPKRVAHTVMSFVSSMFSSSSDNNLRGSTAVQRFERFADGASEFLRYVELGGTPCRYMFSVPLIRHLLAVIQMYLLGHVALSVGNNWQSVVIDGESQTSPTRDFPNLKLGAHFSPHASFDDLSPAVGASVSEIINDEAKHCAMYANISFEQLGEITMPKAVDWLSRNLEATSYQMSWKSKHGSAYLRARRPHGEQLLGRTKLENAVSNGRTRRFQLRDGQVLTVGSLLARGLRTRLPSCRARSLTIGFRNKSDPHYRCYWELMPASMIVQSRCCISKITVIWQGSSRCQAR